MNNLMMCNTCGMMFHPDEGAKCFRCEPDPTYMGYDSAEAEAADPRMTPTNDAPVTVEQDPYLATIEEFEHEDQRELCRLYNHRPDDSLQFSRSNMREAIRHGRRLAGLASAPAGQEAAFRAGAEAMQRALADALRDHLNSRAAAIANSTPLPEYQA